LGLRGAFRREGEEAFLVNPSASDGYVSMLGRGGRNGLITFPKDSNMLANR